MGLTKQYLRYIPSPAPFFGVISSPNGQAVFVTLDGVSDRFVASSTCEDISIWDTKTGEKVRSLNYTTSSSLKDPSEVLCLAPTKTGLLAAGYANGVIRIFDVNSSELRVTLSGHSTGVNCLSFDDEGMKLASGGKDTEIVVWDVVSECGLFRLKGHKHVITQVKFLPSNPSILVSSSRDTFVKFWDLSTQHCFKTLTGHRSEVWNFCIISKYNWLVTGCADSELRVWHLDFDKESQKVQEKDIAEDTPDGFNDDESFLKIRRIGSFLRQSVTPIRNIVIDENELFLVCHGRDQMFESFKIRTSEEVQLAVKKRVKRDRKRALKEDQNTPEVDLSTVQVSLADQVESLPPVKASSKIKHIDVMTTSGKCLLNVLLTSNAIDVYGIGIPNPPATPFELIGAIRNEGHRTDIRSVAFSSDNYFILTASADAIKVWSRISGRCIVSVTDNIGYSLCCLFAPGDKNCLVGTKEGVVSIFDISDSRHLESIQVSEEGQPIWGMDLYPNKKGLVTASEDKTVKFWDFELTDDESHQEESSIRRRRLAIRHTRTLTLEDGVLAVKISPNFKFIAASLLDSTVKIFFVDTLKFFLNLYGHKYPVLTMDISTDSTLIVTGSSDKNIKVWGLDFGDCHKSMFAHDEPVTCVRFLPNTHYVFSCGKDGLLKEWDVDSFNKITTLKGHLGEIWSLAISPNGKFVVTASHDRSIRVWNKTNEPLVLEDEQEQEREEEEEKNLFEGDAGHSVIVGEGNQETGLAGKKTAITLRGTELLMEAIDVHKSESLARKTVKDLSTHEPNPLLLKYNTRCHHRFVLETIRSIRSADLDEALLSLPFSYASDLLRILVIFLERDWEVELVNRVVTFLSRAHFGQITSSEQLRPVMERLSDLSLKRSQEVQKMIGVNLAALRFLQDKINEKEEVALFAETFDRLKEKKNKKKKGETDSTSAPVLKIT